jgi:flagellin
MLQRMRELAVQAANDTYSTNDRSALQLEYDALSDEITRIHENTRWNDMNIFNSAATSAIGSAGSVTLQVGMNGSASDAITVTFQSIAASALGVSGLSLSSYTSASSAIATIDAAIEEIDSFRATLGANINRLTYAADNLTNVSMNASASRSRIQDTDYASATTELARTQIIQQAATAMLAQANQQPQNVLSLLR